MPVRSYRPFKAGAVSGIVPNAEWVVAIYEDNQIQGSKLVPGGGWTFRDAAFYRNRLIAEAAWSCYAFWDGASRGTANTIEHCKDLGYEPVIIYPDYTGELERPY